MTTAANDNRRPGLAEGAARFTPEAALLAQGLDWAEELTSRPRRFAPGARFYGDDRLAVALWWAARRHARPDCFLGADDAALVVDMRPRRDADGAAYLEGRQLNAFLDHLCERSDGALLSLVYLRPHPANPAQSMLQAAIDAISRGAREAF